MAQKLTDRTAFGSTVDPLNDWVHLVDVSDTSQDPAGSSFKAHPYELVDSLFMVQDYTNSVLLIDALMPIGRIPFIKIDNAALKTITIQNDATLTTPAIGYSFEFSQEGAGQVQVVAGGGVTLVSPDGAVVTRTQYSQGRCIKTAANTWEISGDVL